MLLRLRLWGCSGFDIIAFELNNEESAKTITYVVINLSEKLIRNCMLNSARLILANQSQAPKQPMRKFYLH